MIELHTVFGEKQPCVSLYTVRHKNMAANFCQLWHFLIDLDKLCTPITGNKFATNACIYLLIHYLLTSDDICDLI